MSDQLLLPRANGTFSRYVLGQPSPFPASAKPSRSRVAYAAAHVVCDPLAENGPGTTPVLDWEATLAYRRHLWSLGFSIAEAMDTAQRGMGLDWTVAKELIRRSLAEARATGGGVASGAGTDQLAPSPQVTLDQVKAAYAEQCSFIESQGGQIILMASRALAACAKSPDDYLEVYDYILSQVSRPVILHWLGDMFDPALAGYWGHQDLDLAQEVCLNLIETHTSKIDGIKISLLNADREVAMRQRLPSKVRMYTGDDFNYPALIKGDEQGYSHALLGIFDAIAPAAAAALQALDEGKVERYHEILEPTVALSRLIFQVPTYFYKTGVVFLAYLNGYQSHFRMVGGMESGRSVIHLTELLVLADKAGLIKDPQIASERMRRFLALAGIV